MYREEMKRENKWETTRGRRMRGMSASRANAGGRWMECDLLFLWIEKTL